MKIPTVITSLCLLFLLTATSVKSNNREGTQANSRTGLAEQNLIRAMAIADSAVSAHFYRRPE